MLIGSAALRRVVMRQGQIAPKSAVTAKEKRR